MHLFSIIVPVHNGEKTLAQCLKAIIKIKGFEKCELIVANDGSTDSSFKIAQKYSDKVVSNQVNKGAAATRNIGAQAAQGKFLLFIDDDVILSSRNILKYIKEDFKSSDICGVFGVYDEKIAFNDFFSAYKHLYMSYGKLTSKRLNQTADSAMMAIPRESYLAAGGFNEKYLGAMAEDIEFSIRFSLKENKPFLQDSRITGIHYQKHNFKSLCKTNRSRIKGIAKTIQKEDYRKVYLKMSKSSSGKPLFPMILTIGFLILSLFYPLALLGLLISFILFALVQVGLFKYIRRKRGFIFALSSVGFSFIEMFIALVFASYYQLYYKLKK